MALPLRAPATAPPEAVIALRDVDVQIKDGQSVGMIGNNGAGKTTLLRLIAGVTEPSRGTVRVEGTVASMIELGIGFHPEFTGAENLRHAASLLGMARSRLNDLWDEIVEFSGVAHALDQPVRGYSSGMLARLGYSLAVHSDAEVIVVDEVLAVGDYDFQVRGLERIVQLHGEGRTTILVTHNVAALPSLCDRILRLDNGSLVADGSPKEILPEYISEEERKLEERLHLPVEIRDVELEPDTLEPLESLTIRGTVEAHEAVSWMRVNLRVSLGAGRLAAIDRDDRAARVVNMPIAIDLAEGPGSWRVEVKIASLPLSPGEFAAGLVVVDRDGGDLRRELVPLSVTGDPSAADPLHLKLEQHHARL